MVYCAPAFNDDLFSATDLNRRGGYVLDRALKRPVTITRKEQAFALLPRDEMSKLIEATQQTKVLLEVINVAYRLSQGQNIGSEHPYGWLKAFDSEELNELIVELLDAYRCGVDTEEWSMLNTVIHEWQESAIAINSQELNAAFDDTTEEVPLTRPHSESVEAK